MEAAPVREISLGRFFDLVIAENNYKETGHTTSI